MWLISSYLSFLAQWSWTSAVTSARTRIGSTLTCTHLTLVSLLASALCSSKLLGYFCIDLHSIRIPIRIRSYWFCSLCLGLSVLSSLYCIRTYVGRRQCMLLFWWSTLCMYHNIYNTQHNTTQHNMHNATQRIRHPCVSVAQYAKSESSKKAIVYV